MGRGMTPFSSPGSRPHKRLPLLLLGALAGLAATAATAAERIVVGIVTDGPAVREPLPIDQLIEETRAVLGEDLQVEMPARLRRDGGWSIAGINGALDALLADPEVDVIVTMGLISSNQAARRTELPRPVIAPAVADPILEGYPLTDGRSGRRNFTYIADFVGLKPQLDAFFRITGARHLAAVVDELFLDAVPELAMLAEQLRLDLGVRITLVAAADSADQVMASLPADADAVFVSGLPRMPTSQLRELARAIQMRGLPSMASSRADVEAGLLLAHTGDRADSQRIARRIALDIGRIHAGEQAAAIEVALVVQPRLLINMQTAREIGFSPRWDDLVDAEQLHAQPAIDRPALSLLETMHRALAANPDLDASRWSARAAADDVRGARARLLPNITFTESATRIDADHASPLTRAEKSATRELSLRQSLFADDAWAGHAIASRLAIAADAGLRSATLDTLQSAAVAYLDLLHAQAAENVRRANVELTRQNLETSRVRETVGLAGRSDNLRWIAQLARERSRLLEAESQRQQAETRLRRVLHLPDGEPIRTTDAGLADPLALVGDARMRAFMDTPARWEAFGHFAVDSARRQSPEIVQAEAQVQARERSLTNAKRAFFLPDLALVSRLEDPYWKAGAGSGDALGVPGGKSWSVTLQASIPVFDGGERRADLSRSRHELKQAQATRESVRDGVDARMRSSIQRVGASYPSIDLSATAAAAAAENLRMVSDAYGRGLVSVTELVDAQETALSAELAAAQSRYAFLADFIDVLRAMGDFSVLLEPAARGAWYDQINAWFRQQGTAPPAVQP
jgi:outer membrane protein TolC/ABC-type uncharacterized transport system substrate-binding protein